MLLFTESKTMTSLEAKMIEMKMEAERLGAALNHIDYLLKVKKAGEFMNFCNDTNTQFVLRDVRESSLQPNRFLILAALRMEGIFNTDRRKEKKCDELRTAWRRWFPKPELQAHFSEAKINQYDSTITFSIQINL